MQLTTHVQDIYGQGHASLHSQNEEVAASCASMPATHMIVAKARGDVLVLECSKAEGNRVQETACMVTLVTPCECCTIDNHVVSTSHINFGLGSTVTLQHV